MSYLEDAFEEVEEAAGGQKKRPDKGVMVDEGSSNRKAEFPALKRRKEEASERFHHLWHHLQC